MDSIVSEATIRPAVLEDLDGLVDVETACFLTDRISRRSFRHLLIKGHQSTRVLCDPTGQLIGYAMVLFHQGTSLARLYSLAVLPDRRGKGYARALLAAAEDAAADGDAAYLRLEVHAGNEGAIALYRQAGYKPFGRITGYYEDGGDALRLDKALIGSRPTSADRIPYYAQSLDFTCGPACLMMAMTALKPETPMTRREELRLWREATTVFMTKGPAGCSPYGMALAAAARGFDVRVHVRDPDVMFIDSVRSQKKKDVIRLVQEDYLAQLQDLEIPVDNRALTLPEVQEVLDSGGIPIVLISTYALDREKVPHWVVVVALSDRFVFVHDPFVDPDVIQSQTDRMALPIPREDFERMSRYGRARQRAALVLRLTATS
ncbi:peptidase C39 family protein [Hwanghaeella sp. LZ110]|jgi:ribosomal protein S18 acetylase RimI-like enzyme/predicted double-glycine peptidase|uniref:peptidase C39 family protein n=1 Tax=Hwanghaeella sp. LZ110 TaxID=3402810 RepID=UPI003B6753E6